MAERISHLTPRRGRPEIYPWAEWMDGHAWRITRGEDFQIEPANMASLLRQRAAKTGHTVSARIDGDAVSFQFTQEAAA